VREGGILKTMDNEKVGQFILELRRSNQMTQKELAEKLNISDKAISKWERGLSYPDIALLSPLSDILGVTITELLNGQRAGHEAMNMEASVVSALEYGGKAAKRKIKLTHNIWAAAFSIVMFIGIMVCTICDIAISGTLTWSLIPISSIIFAWISFYPVIKYGKKGIIYSLITFSVFIIPFLGALNAIIDANGMIFIIGVRMAAISIVFLWTVFALFKRFKSRIFAAFAISLLLTIPANIVIDFALSTIVNIAFFDIWDVMSYSIVSVAAIILFVIDNVRKKSA
jgi:transcriptional regulator with XRE-family HTH domain